jgi:transposase
VIDVVEVLEHWYAGRPKAVVAESLGVDRKTVRKYVVPAEEAGLVPGGPAVTTEEWAAYVRSWFPELILPELRSATFAECAAHHEAIKVMLATNHLATIHQRLRDEQGFAPSESSLRRYVDVALADVAKADRVTVRKEDAPPGEEAQVDYGRLGMWFDPEAGRRRALWAFIMVLSSSRHCFVRPTLVMDQAEWVAAHVAAAAFFGGLPRRLVVDNLKDGVIKADLYDPLLNRAYAEFAHHYGVLIDPARAAKPKDKPKVERIVPYCRESLFAGRDIATLAGWRAEAVRWSTEVAGERHCRPLEGAAPLAVFQATEAAALIALPTNVFELAAWSKAKVHDDCQVKVAKTLYTVPWRYIGQEVETRCAPPMVTIHLRGEVIKTHVFKAKGRQTDWNDYPPDKIAFLQKTPAWCLRRSGDIGPGCTELIAELLAVNVSHHLRAAQGILHLADRHGPARLEAACRRASDAGDPSYRTVKGILAAGAEADAEPEERGTDTPAYLRGPEAIVGIADMVVSEAEAIVAGEQLLLAAASRSGEATS